MTNVGGSYVRNLLSSCSPCAFSQLVAVTFPKQIITLKCRKRLARLCSRLSVLLISPQRGTVKLWCQASAAFRGVEEGLTVYLQPLIAGNEMPSGADQQTRLQQPSAISKPPSISTSHFVCRGTPALNGTLPFSFHLLVKIH